MKRSMAGLIDCHWEKQKCFPESAVAALPGTDAAVGCRTSPASAPQRLLQGDPLSALHQRVGCDSRLPRVLSASCVCYGWAVNAEVFLLPH